MTLLEIPKEEKTINDSEQIKNYLAERGVFFEQWSANQELSLQDGQEEVLAAYSDSLTPYMEQGGYQTADVIRVRPDLENIDAIRAKFLAEHTHSEDEVRFFVEGKGAFWFNLADGGPVFCVICESGDLISVPAGAKHWFDMGSNPLVTAIRIFSNQEGWVPNYTQSDVAAEYNKDYDAVL